MLRLSSKYVYNQHQYQGDSYVEAVLSWILINKVYVDIHLEENKKLLQPLSQELDNLQALVDDIIQHHEAPRRPQ